MTPFIIWFWCIPSPTFHWIGLVIFIVAGLTDFADGRIARHLQQTSRFGSYVDPFADKLLVLGSAVALVFDHRIFLWWFVVVLARELAVTTLRSVLKPGAHMPASRIAKWKTVTQLFSVGAASVLTGPVPIVLLALSGVMTVWTGYEYIRGYWKWIDI